MPRIYNETFSFNRRLAALADLIQKLDGEKKSCTESSLCFKRNLQRLTRYYCAFHVAVSVKACLFYGAKGSTSVITEPKQENALFLGAAVPKFKNKTKKVKSYSAV